MIEDEPKPPYLIERSMNIVSIMNPTKVSDNNTKNVSDEKRPIKSRVQQSKE